MTSKSVTRRVAYRIGFGLDNSPAYPALGQVVDQCLADQEARKLDRVDGKLGSANTPDARGLCWWHVSIHAIAGLSVDPFARRAGPDTTDDGKFGASTAGKIKLAAKSCQENGYQSRVNK